MAWFYIRLPGGTLKIKPRSHLRHDEMIRRVPVLFLGAVVVSWWSSKRVDRGVSRPATGRPTADRSALDRSVATKPPSDHG